MLIYTLKLCISLAVILLSSELAKRSPSLGAFVVALPLVSLLSMTWLYVDTGDSEKVGAYAREIFYLVPLSLIFFLPFLLESKTHWGYWLNCLLGLSLMALAFLGVAFFKTR